MPSTIIPGLRYRDAHAAIDFLCKAFGFQRHAVYEADDGSVMHAQLTYGDGMIMLGSVRKDDSVYSQLSAQPDEINGRETQCACVTVTDCRAHYEQAKEAGARIVDEYTEKDYGGAGYAAADPEGHIWWFGSYDPWAEPVKN
jgi:uncharacterized glyoxalase superfamily protein PhnB